MQQQNRIWAFDAARSVMMLLGILIHTSLVIDYFFASITPVESAFFKISYLIIHIFRMPVFFIVGGFFAAYLILEKGPRSFVVSRFKRLVSPLIAAELAIAAVLFFNGCRWCENANLAQFDAVLAEGWLYLWFLFYLVLVSHAALLLHLVWAKVISPRFASQRKFKSFSVSMSPWQVGVLSAGASFIPNVFETNSDGLRLRVAMGLFPDVSMLLFFGLLFLSGWLMYKNRGVALATVQKWWWLNLSIAALGYFVWPMAAVWFASFAVLGIFLSFASKKSLVFDYLSDASYWIYLVHPPIVIALLAWFGSMGWPASVAATVEMIVTCAITLGSYQLLIRHTIAGKWLSGRRRPTRKEREKLLQS